MRIRQGQVVLQSNPDFWRLVEKRRKEKTVSLVEMKQRLKNL